MSFGNEREFIDFLQSKESYAKQVFDLDRGLVDRTELPHRYKVDIDVRSPSAPADRQMWIYWGSAKSLEQAESKARKECKDPSFQLRFVDAETGQVLKTVNSVRELN